MYNAHRDKERAFKFPIQKTVHKRRRRPPPLSYIYVHFEHSTLHINHTEYLYFKPLFRNIDVKLFFVDVVVISCMTMGVGETFLYPQFQNKTPNG